MPRKRHQNQYSKPQSTPPSSLAPSSSAGPRSNSKNTQPRTVNSILASLRTSHAHATPQLEPGGQQQVEAPHTASMPPLIRQILHIPESTLPPPRRRGRNGPDGRRLPPGPAPPASWASPAGVGPAGRRGHGGDWLSTASSLSKFQLTTSKAGHETNYESLLPRLPGAHKLEPGSLVDMALRKMAHTWSFQSSFNRYYLYSLPGSLRSALLATLCRHHVEGVTLADLRALLTVPDYPTDQHGGASVTTVDWEREVTAVNDDFHELDLSGCIGRTITLKDLFTFLFGTSRPSSDPGPPLGGNANAKRKDKGKRNAGEVAEEIQESWETYSPSPSPAPFLDYTLPYLTRLSLALPPTLVPGEPKRYINSWKQLLSLTSKLQTLTHLSLANWTVPTLTTGYIPATLPLLSESASDPAQKNDLAEAVLIFRKLSKSLYRLQYLDVSGCSEWWDVLRHLTEPVAAHIPDPQPVLTPSLGRRVNTTSLADSQPGTSSETNEISNGGCGNSAVGDGVDWVGDWGKIETVVMKSRLSSSPPDGPDDFWRYDHAVVTAKALERHVRSQRLGRGRWFSTERDPVPDSWVGNGE